MGEDIDGTPDPTSPDRERGTGSDAGVVHGVEVGTPREIFLAVALFGDDIVVVVVVVTLAAVVVIVASAAAVEAAGGGGPAELS